METKYCNESKVIQTHRVFPFDLNPFGYLFGGKLMTYIDDAASISVSRHCRRGAVTASVDQLTFIHPLHANHSCCVESFISGVHHRSMEVFVKVIGEDLVTGERYLAASCFVTYVAIVSFMNEEPDFQVPFVIAQSDEEKMVCSGYEQRRATKKIERQAAKQFHQSLSVDLPWIQ